MGQISQAERAKIKRAIEREIDELVRAKIESDADFERAEIEKARRRAGLPRAPEANFVQVQLQKLVGLLNISQRAHVLDLLRESVCHQLLRKANWAEKTEPPSDEHRVRVELLSDITVEVENRVLRIHKKSFAEKAEWFDKKQERIYKKASVARGVVDRMERKIEVYEAAVQEVAMSRGWLAEEGKEVVFAPELFESLEQKVRALEKLRFESDKLLEALPAVDLESLSIDDLKELGEAVAVAAEYFASACSVVAGVLKNIDEAISKGSEQISTWQERYNSAKGQENEKDLRLCHEYIIGYRRYLKHYNESAEKVRKYSHDLEAKSLKMQRVRDYIYKRLNNDQIPIN